MTTQPDIQSLIWANAQLEKELSIIKPAYEAVILEVKTRRSVDADYKKLREAHDATLLETRDLEAKIARLERALERERDHNDILRAKIEELEYEVEDEKHRVVTLAEESIARDENVIKLLGGLKKLGLADELDTSSSEDEEKDDDL